jgi:hypothetical protein
MKSTTTKNIILSCCLFLLVACVCVSLILVTGAGVSVLWPFDIPQEEVLPVPLDVPQDPTAPPLAELEELPDDLAEMIHEIENQVIQIRGLHPTEFVDRTLITADELRQIVADDFFSDYSEQDARNDVLILSLLGLLPEDFDLKSFYNDLYSEQIAGFYDSETKEIFVVKKEAFGGNEKLTYAHEFTHVLQDQVFNFDEGLNYNEDACQEDSERCAAIQALIEGDATQTEILWFQTYATRDDYDDLMQTYESFESPILDAAPPYMVADLYFPYEKGFAFVERLYKEGGFAAVDAAYQNPPVSTKQILHPEFYPDHRPKIVILPELDEIFDSAWILYDQNIMGEWYTFLILNQAYEETHRLGESQAKQASEGWEGDAYAFYLNENTDEVVFVLDTVWETSVDAEEFAGAFQDYAGLRWEEAVSKISGLPTWTGSGLTTVLQQDGDRTVWVTAPSEALAEAIISALQ